MPTLTRDVVFCIPGQERNPRDSNPKVTETSHCSVVCSMIFHPFSRDVTLAVTCDTERDLERDTVTYFVMTKLDVSAGYCT